MAELKDLKVGESLNPENGCETIPSQSVTEGVTTMNLSKEELRGAVIGMILGDGHISLSQRSVNGHIDFSHGAKQREYALSKAGILQGLTSVRVTYPIDKLKDGRPYPKVRVITKTHPLYTHLWKRFYHLGRKTVDTFLMEALTPLGLALWYQDDGCLKNHEGFLTPVLEANSFNVAEHRIIEKAMADKFGLEFRTNKLNAKYLSLRLRRKDRETFYNIVRPYIHPTMAYKIEDDGKVVQLIHEPIKFNCEVCGTEVVRPYNRHNRPNRFCARCYQEERGSIKGSAQSKHTESRYSLSLLATAGV